MLLLLYLPALIFLPILLLAGIIFVVVPGGFIVVLAAAAYFLSVASIGLVGLAGKGWQAVRANRRRIMASSARRRPAQQTPSRGPRAALEAPVTAGSRNDGPIGFALNFAPPSSGTGRPQPRPAPDAASVEHAADQSRAA